MDRLDGYLDIGATNYTIDIRSVHATGDVPSQIVALIALLNDALPDGHPNKLTDEDVAFLREVESAPYAGLWSDSARTLAAKIAALLPPR